MGMIDLEIWVEVGLRFQIVHLRSDTRSTATLSSTVDKL